MWKALHRYLFERLTVILTFILSFAAGNAGGQPTVQMVEGSEEHRQVQITQDGHLVDLEVGTIEFVAAYPEVTSRHLAYVIFYPTTGRFWWSVGVSVPFPLRSPDLISQFLEGHSVYILPDKVCVFKVASGRIQVRESLLIYSSNPAALASLTGLVQETVGKHQLSSLFQDVHLTRRLGVSFFHRGASMRLDARIASVTHEDSKWKVILENYKNRRATVVLNAEYEVLEVQGPIKP